MNEIATPEQKQIASKLRNMMAVYRDYEDLISIGAYKSGTNPELDDAIRHINGINEFLCQQVGEKFDLEETIALMAQAVS